MISDESYCTIVQDGRSWLADAVLESLVLVQVRWQ